MVNILKPGETFTWTDKDIKNHTVTISRFLEHDHEHYPIYYLDFPLTAEDIEEEKENMVISVQGFGFSQRYTGSLGPGGEWHFNNCPQGNLFFMRPGDDEVIEMWFTPKSAE